MSRKDCCGVYQNIDGLTESKIAGIRMAINKEITDLAHNGEILDVLK